MKIIFGGYRDWALGIVDDLREKIDHQIVHVRTRQDLERACTNKKNYVILLAGWSWYVSSDILESNTVVGLHPSDLPDYAGGTPIQHQIIDGLEDSKMTLFELNEEYDRGYIIQKCDLDLRGGMKDIFNNLRTAGTSLLLSFISAYPNYRKHSQKNTKAPRKRLKPEESELTMEKFSTMSAKDLYNFIRCREDPYPNVFVQDETGRLLFKSVEFKSD